MKKPFIFSISTGLTDMMDSESGEFRIVKKNKNKKITHTSILQSVLLNEMSHL